MIQCRPNRALHQSRETVKGWLGKASCAAAARHHRHHPRPRCHKATPGPSRGCPKTPPRTPTGTASATRAPLGAPASRRQTGRKARQRPTPPPSGTTAHHPLPPPTNHQPKPRRNWIGKLRTWPSTGRTDGTHRTLAAVPGETCRRTRQRATRRLLPCLAIRPIQRAKTGPFAGEPHPATQNHRQHEKSIILRKGFE